MSVELLKKAWIDVSKCKEKFGGKDGYGQKFRDYVRKVASSIIELGLAPTLAFIYSQTDYKKFQNVKRVFDENKSLEEANLGPEKFAWGSILYFLNNLLYERHGYDEKPDETLAKLLKNAVENPSALIYAEQEVTIYLNWLKNLSEPLWD